jgi:ribonuclease HI
MSQYEDLLRERAQPFLKRLREEGFEASLYGASNHMIKASLSRNGEKHGPVLIYYSPNRNEFTLKGHEMRTDDLFDQVEELFEESASLNETDKKMLPGVHIYVDGSFIDGNAGYGWVAYFDGQVRHEENGPVSDPGMTRQVAGELEATMEALKWCVTESIGMVHLHYDYEGIEHWATGAWQAKNPITQVYTNFMSECPVDITWVNEEAHSGIEGNERADQLAKEGAIENKPATASNADSDPIEELHACTEDFLDYLGQALDDSPFNVVFEGIHNDQYARLNVLIDGERRGIVDIYNTKNKHLQPRFHAFQDSLHEETLETCWSKYTNSVPSKGENALRQAEHYHGIYSPYREASKLDFSPFAEALERAYAIIEETELSLDGHRYDFEELERHFHNLQEKE